MSSSPATRAQAGSVILTALDVPYVQDFNTLASSGTSSSLPAGWEFVEAGTNANTIYTAGTGSGNAGDTYSFGGAGSTERAFGGLQSGSLIPSIGAVFTNSTDQTITSIDISYTGEQWRLGATGRADRLDFQYSLDATSLSAGTWIDVDPLDFNSPVTTGSVGALTGASAAVSSAISGIAIPPGASFRIRWTDFNAASADDGLSIDDFSVTPHTGGAPVVSVGDVSVAEGNSGTLNATFIVSVSSAAHTGITFNIATAADETGSSPATAGEDYAGRSATNQTIPAGTTTYAFDVAISGDLVVEDDETFQVLLTSVSGATLADGIGIGTIVNDDEPPPVDTDVVISQVYGGGGNAGATLTHDFVELFNPGSNPVNLTGWSVQYTSATGTGTWQVTPLSGFIEPGHYYLIQQAQGTGGTAPLPAPDATGTIAMAAGSGKVALQNTITPIVGNAPSGGTADLVGYGAASFFEGSGPTAPASNTTAALRKRGGCFDSDNNNIDFAIGNPAPRNSSTPARSCTPIQAAIHEIQGSGASSPLSEQDVITSGVVTGVKVNGFFLQTPDAEADANPNSSQGIFVFTSATPAVSVGNVLIARGTASEFFELTQIEASLPGDVNVTASNAALPSAITLTSQILDPAGPPDQLERFEGMRLIAPFLTSVAPTDEFGEIATVLSGIPRPIREPGIPVSDPVPPDPTTGVTDCCIPRFDENPERIVIDTEGLVGMPVVTVTSHVAIGNVTGPLDFSFGAYKILPALPLSVGPNISGVAVPVPAAGEFTVGGFNIENFAGNDTRRRKAALAIRQLMQSPDVIGHIEILDLATLQSLADQVNADAVAASESNPAYQAVLIPAPPLPGGNPSTQNVGFLVKTSRVRVDAVSQELANETFVNPTNGQTETLHDRPPLVLRATVDPLGLNPRPVIVIVNHLRSFIDIGLVAGEGPRVRAKRTAQAESVAGLLQELQTTNPGIAIISVGDYNAYEFNDGYTDPIAILKGAPTPDDQMVVDASPDLVNPNFVNLTDALPLADRYSFIFEGTPQALDHVLVNTVANSYVQRYAIARGNSDFPALPAFAEDVTRPERSSDHDMPVAYFRFPSPSADLEVTMTASQPGVDAGGQVAYTIVVTNNGDSPASNAIVTGTLAPELGLVSCTATGDGVCGSAATPAVTFPRLDPGASETVTLLAAVSCAAVNGSSIASIATVSAATVDPVPANNSTSALVTVVNAAPTIVGAAASRTQLLPVHQLVPVGITYSAADTCGAVTTTLSVSSDEPVTGSVIQQGLAGLTAPDWDVIDAQQVLLRAERSLRGDGRVYTILITATDAAGGQASQAVTVTVPRFILGFRD